MMDIDRVSPSPRAAAAAEEPLGDPCAISGQVDPGAGVSGSSAPTVGAADPVSNKPCDNEEGAVGTDMSSEGDPSQGASLADGPHGDEAAAESAPGSSRSAGGAVADGPVVEWATVPDDVAESARALFADRLPSVLRYVALLADTGVRHGLVGPHEGERLWHRHLLNCAVLSELIEPGARLVDIGSGAGLPGIPLALARPDLEIVLLEPMARRVHWLRGTVQELDLPVMVVRGRAEEAAVRREWRGADVVTARAVAPLARLARWALPLLRPGGQLLAVKGVSATDEVNRDRAAVHDFGGLPPRVVQCGGMYVDPPTTVVAVERMAPRAGSAARGTRRMSGRPCCGGAHRRGTPAAMTQPECIVSMFHVKHRHDKMFHVKRLPPLAPQ